MHLKDLSEAKTQKGLNFYKFCKKLCNNCFIFVMMNTVFMLQSNPPGLYSCLYVIDQRSVKFGCISAKVISGSTTFWTAAVFFAEPYAVPTPTE